MSAQHNAANGKRIITCDNPLGGDELNIIFLPRSFHHTELGPAVALLRVVEQLAHPVARAYHYLVESRVPQTSHHML